MAKQPTVLICGGSGLIGRHLQKVLRARDYRVTVLSRRHAQANLPDYYYWDPGEGFLNPDALNARHIVNLAGASVADKKWSPRRKAQIINSRVDSADILYKKLTELKRYPQTYLSASAIGYYGDRGDEILTEDSPAGTGFLADTTRRWEQAAHRFTTLGMRTVMLRIGVVLAADGGALTKLAQPVRWMAGAPLGSGEQYMSWIHVDDVCGMIVRALEDENWDGPVNAVAPEPVTNAELTRRIAARLDKPLLLPNVPQFALRFLLGEMADMVLESARVSCAKAEAYGYEFQYPDLDQALRDLLSTGAHNDNQRGARSRPT
jgi:hypothetical protein